MDAIKFAWNYLYDKYNIGALLEIVRCPGMPMSKYKVMFPEYLTRDGHVQGYVTIGSTTSFRWCVDSLIRDGLVSEVTTNTRRYLYPTELGFRFARKYLEAAEILCGEGLMAEYMSKDWENMRN